MKAQSIRIWAAGCVVASLALVLPGVSRAATDDEGFAVGTNGRFQPGIRVAAAYQSNVYRTETEAEGDITLRVEPHLRLIHRSDDVDFRLYGEYFLKKYTNAFVDQAYDPMGHRDLDIFLNYKLGLGLMTRPEGKFSFIFKDDFGRLSSEFDNANANVDPDSNAVAPRFRKYSLLDRLLNQGQIGFAIRPGSSLQVEALFHLDTVKYSSAFAQGLSPDATNRYSYGTAWDFYGTVDVSWRFFPRTNLLFSADFGHVMWAPDLQESVGDNIAPGLEGLNQYDSDHWRIWFGIQGKFSRKISVQGMFGYGNAYFPDSPDNTGDAKDGNLNGADGILGKLQVHWTPVMTQRFTLGFIRDYRWLYFSNYYITTSPYLRYKGQIGGFLFPEAGFGYALRQINGDVDRVDHEVRAFAGAKFQLTSFLSVGVHYNLWSIVASSPDDEPTFTDHEIALGIELGF